MPAFLGLNLWGNHAVDPDPGIRLSTRWMANDAEHAVESNRATERSRGTSASRWPIEAILRRGYGLATAYYGDLEPEQIRVGVERFAGVIGELDEHEEPATDNASSKVTPRDP